MKSTFYFLCLGLLAQAFPVVAQDPFGRTLGRVLKTESMVYNEDDLKTEKAEIDKYPPDQRERMPLSMVVFQLGESGKIAVELKIRSGGEVAASMKGVRLEVEPKKATLAWSITSGSFAPSWAHPSTRPTLNASPA